MARGQQESLVQNGLYCHILRSITPITKISATLLSLIVLSPFTAVFQLSVFLFVYFLYIAPRGHGGRMVTLSPPTSAAGVRSPSWQ